MFVFKKGRAPHINNFGLGEGGRYRTNVWDYAGINSFGKTRDQDLAMHPTVKPVNLIADAIRDCSRRNDIILDVFGGSGSTLIAAEQAGRRARLLEIDPTYCDAIIKRWQDLTGKQAILDASEPNEVIEASTDSHTGTNVKTSNASELRSFDEVRQERRTNAKAMDIKSARTRPNEQAPTSEVTIVELGS